MNTSPLVEEKMVDGNLWHGTLTLTPFYGRDFSMMITHIASPAPGPMSRSLGLREIHRSVLFAKAGSSLICRICL